MFDSKEVDAVSLPLPNHWHALATIWACQRARTSTSRSPPATTSSKATQMVAAARKYNRMVQVGSQGRSITHKKHAVQLLREGAIGQVYHARGLCFRRRFSIGHTPDAPVPPGLDWDLFLGPAPDEAIQQKQVRVQLALVLGYRQWRYRQPGRARNGHLPVGPRARRLAGFGYVHRRQVRLEGRPGDAQHAARRVRFRRGTADVRRSQPAHASRGCSFRCGNAASSATCFSATSGLP